MKMSKNKKETLHIHQLSRYVVYENLGKKYYLDSQNKLYELKEDKELFFWELSQNEYNKVKTMQFKKTNEPFALIYRKKVIR